MTAPSDPLVGKTLSGRFRILEPLGVGGMGKVYKALQTPLDRMVALKVLNPKYGVDKDPGFERRFFLEAAMTAKLHHPNTITVHDYGRTDEGIFFIAMEFVEGETLLQVLQREGHITWQRAFHVGGQICRSLREAHKMGIVHRDLKPANVMVLHEETGTDMVKVLDFGLVKSFTPEGPLSPSEEMPGGLTQQGVLLGSPLYMAPEQARNELDPRSDIYSLGVLLYQCIAGKPPFSGKESIDIIVKHIREPVPTLVAPMGDLPDPARELVMRCLAKEPGDRFQSMDEVLEAMKAAGANAGYSGAFTDPRSPSFSNNTGSKPVKLDSRATKAPANPGDTRAASLATPSPGAPRRNTESVEVSVSGLTGPRSRRNLFIGFSVVGLLVGGAGAFIAVNTTKPPARKPIVVPPLDVTPPPVPGTQKPPDLPVKPTTVPVKVIFDIRSTPDGARVIAKGTTLGETPLKHEIFVPAGETKATLEVTFTLDGYQSQTLTYVAESPGQLFEAKLEKLKGKDNKKKKDPGNKQPPGYKESPY